MGYSINELTQLCINIILLCYECVPERQVALSAVSAVTIIYLIMYTECWQTYVVFVENCFFVFYYLSINSNLKLALEWQVTHDPWYQQQSDYLLSHFLLIFHVSSVITFYREMMLWLAVFDLKFFWSYSSVERGGGGCKV